jgi:hypothetical protein
MSRNYEVPHKCEHRWALEVGDDSICLRYDFDAKFTDYDDASMVNSVEWGRKSRGLI